MKVILLRDWMGRTKGTEMNIVDQQAHAMIQRGTARAIDFKDEILDRQIKESPVEKRKYERKS